MLVAATAWRPERRSPASYDRGMSITVRLADAEGVYFGTGDGVESGPFVARIEVRRLPNGGASIDYEATSREQGVQHREHTILSPGLDGRDRLYIAHSESPVVTEMIASETDGARFVQTVAGGPFTMQVVIEMPEPGRLSYAWWWATAGEEPVEQSRADVRLPGPGE